MIRATAAILAIALCALSGQAQAQSHVPQGRHPSDTALTQAIHKALPAGATEVNKPLPVTLPPLGRVRIVIYRKSADDHQVHALALIPSNSTYRAATLPDPQTPATEEEIATSVLSARLTPDTRALVLLYYTHQPGQPGSHAHGRVYLYQSGSFQLDQPRSQKLEGVRTAAVARLRLIEEQ